MLEPYTNYSLISSKNEQLKHIVTKYILNLNIEQGLYTEPSLFGACILVSDTVKPAKNRYVISYCARPDFIVLNLDKEPLPILFEILGFQLKEAKSFITNFLYKNPKINPKNIYYYLLLMKDCEQADGNFNYTKAKKILETYQFSKVTSLFKKYKALNTFINQSNEANLVNLIQTLGDQPDKKKRLRQIAYLVRQVINDEVPEYIIRQLNFTNNHTTILQYLKLASDIAEFECFETFIGHMISERL